MIKAVHDEKKKAMALILWTCGLLQPLTHSFYHLRRFVWLLHPQGPVLFRNLARFSTTERNIWGQRKTPSNSSIVPFEQRRKWPQEKIDLC